MNPTVYFQGHRLPFLAAISVGIREMGSALPAEALGMPRSSRAPSQKQQQQQQALAPEVGSAPRHQLQQDGAVCPGSSAGGPAFWEKHRRTRGSPDLVVMDSVTTA